MLPVGVRFSVAWTVALVGAAGCNAILGDPTPASPNVDDGGARAEATDGGTEAHPVRAADGGNVDVTAFCRGWSDFDARCGRTSACDNALRARCSDYAGAFSPSAVSALVTCARSMECAFPGGASRRYFDAFNTDCFWSLISASALTPAQRKAEEDYCGGCYGQRSAMCDADLNTSPDAGKVDDKLMTYFVVPKDDVVSDIDRVCTPAIDAGGCESSFVKCAKRIAEEGSPPPSPECTSSTSPSDGGGGG